MYNSSDIGIELGNSKFSICVRGEGVVVSEAAYLAYRGDYPSASSVIAFGDAAKEMYERAHPGIQVINPMREGIVVDCGVAGMIVRGLAKKAGLKRGWVKPKVIVSALYGSSDVERKAFVDVAEGVSRSRAAVVHEPLAAANALGIDISGPSAHMVVDVGDGATEAVLVSLGQTILGHSMRFGGYDVDTLLMDHVRRRCGVMISRSQARTLKERLSSGKQSQEVAGVISIKGIGVHGSLPCEKFVSVTDFYPVLDHAADRIAEFVLDTLGRVPAEASIDLIENGIHLCGGASQMIGVKERIAEKTKLTINAVLEPDQTVIYGVKRMLDFSKYF